MPQNLGMMTASINNPGEQKIKKLGTVRIARGVLETIVERTTLEVSGVVRMDNPVGSRSRFFNREQNEGVEIEVREEKVYANLHIVVDRNMNMADVGKQVQNEVSKAIRNIVGMAVEEINVYIQNVE